MGQMKCQLNWMGDLGFETKIRNHQFLMDSPGEGEKRNRGPSPKEFLLASICGCSGIDVVSILQKMRVNLIKCEVLAETMTTEAHPSVFDHVKLKFFIEATEIKPEQALRAAELSMTKYCGVSAMIVNTSPISYEVFLNNSLIGHGEANFPDVKK